MEVNRGVFLVILIIFIFFTPAGNSPHLSSPDELFRLKEYLHLQRNETELLRHSSWHHAPKNLTGITINGTNYLPPEILNLANKIWHSEDGSNGLLDGWSMERRGLEDSEPVGIADLDSVDPLVFYNNISGIYEGTWKRSKEANGLEPKIMEIPQIFKSLSLKNPGSYNQTLEGLNALGLGVPDVLTYSYGNITEDTGKLSITIHEIPSRNHYRANVTLLDMSITFSDGSESSQYAIELQGLHIKSTGNLVMSTASLKYSGLHLLPHLVLDELHFKEAKSLMLRYLNASINIFEDDLGYDIFEEAETSAESCEYIVYGHIHSVDLSMKELRDVELELQTPLGRPLQKLPALKLSTLFYSPDCAVSLGSDDIEGEKYETYWNRLRIVIVSGVLLLFSQMVLLAQQMKDTSTPSLISKISFYSISMLVVIDGSVWTASFVSSFVGVLALPFIAVSFLSFALTAMFEMRYMVKIYQSQVSEGLADARVREVIQGSSANGQGALYAMPDGSFVGPPVNTTRAPTTPANSLPAPVTAPNPTQAPGPDQSERAIAGWIYSRLYFFLVVFIVVSLIASSWPVQYRIIYEYIAVLVFSSIWVPQIYRNIIRGYRKSFLWSFILGTSVIRLIPLLYVCLDRKNILNHHHDSTLAWLTTSWVSLQIIVLAAQVIFGSRFFIPKGILPVLYDYHPVLYQGDAEAELGIDIASAGQQMPKTSKKKHNTKTPSFSVTNVAAALLHPKKKFKDDSDYEPSTALLDVNDGQVLRPSVDCAICMMPVELIITPRSEAHAQLTSSPALMLARRRYMVTPCQHVFHTVCMEKWMRSRLQCPICRNPLPPL